MSATPGKLRQSGIPGPARTSAIPTPSRSRASSTVLHPNPNPNPNPNPADVEYMSRAFADAIKANDPAHHRPSLTASLSPKSASFSQSGRRSVTGRPSSVASTSSNTGSQYSRAKTPVQSHSRPSSRISDVPKAVSRTFGVGDNVRIESLGFEGVLRYVGPIEGKQGTWAGVQLSGGFAGKGKNNGNVNGFQYFSCPDSCGVFVSVNKLSAPTVGVGAIPRPSSVASSRGGCTAPALSGRITPSTSSSIAGPRMSLSSSISNGRVTPSNTGRITPSLSSGRVTPGTTPAARLRRPLTKTTSTKTEVPVPVGKFTPGSRASKYMSITAKQLSSRNANAGSPSRRLSELESPTRSLSSPSHDLRSPTSIGSPFATPKPGLNGRAGGGILPTPSKIRPSGSLSTPRARLPSAMAMPPPASPMSSRAVSLNRSIDAIDMPDLDAFSKVSQDRSYQLKSVSVTSTRSDSAASVRSSAVDDHVLMDQLQSRINALEYDNERLRAIQSPLDTKADQQIQDGLDDARVKIASLEALLAASVTEKEDQESRIKTLEDDKHRLEAALDDQNCAKESDIAALRGQLDTKLAITEELRTKIGEHEAATRQKETAIQVKDETISTLESRIAAVTAELHDEKIELGAQIDELRSAGQETIALYEERLSAADSQRYDLEQRISTLEARLYTAQIATSPPPPSLTGASAAEIDNETLREQIVHLQRKIATMEDALEDAQASAEREESLVRERMKRLKEKEDTMRQELNDGRKEVEQILKSEAKAKSRVEEIEEALRESTVALENARAEVENLRSELANLDGLVANHSGGDLFSRVAEAAQRAANDKAHYTKEIAQLQDTIKQYRASERTAIKVDDEMKDLKRKNTSLYERIGDQETKMSALLQSLDDTTKELETIRKKQNRDVTINNGLQETLRPVPASPSSKCDVSTAKEEITGLKHIVQELQKENVASLQRIKILESENELLASEANQLQQEVQILEENLDKSLEQEEEAVEGVKEISPRKLREQKGRLEMEQEQLRKRLVEVEMKSTRTIHDLNKEISELEALVESKIYREDELEQEVERLRQQLTRQDKKMTKGSVEAVKEGEGVCEICERPGHDIFGCDVLNKGAGVKRDSELFCEDCESRGHTAADCPHSLDVF
ncbi:hypothetical protein H2248_005132 [Termitomyces sp. 'cryptogamus']|nr:hypothetical protein H2248_005132 [Termitomyces sp. 'cryptogamus']